MPRFWNMACWLIIVALMGCANGSKQQKAQTIFDAGANEALDLVEFELVEVQAQEALRQGIVQPQTPAANAMKKTETLDPKSGDPQHPAPVASACTHLTYRNPVVDRIRIPGGLRGGVYVPTHYEYVVYHTGRWEVVSSVGNPHTTLPPFSSGCLTPPQGKSP